MKKLLFITLIIFFMLTIISNNKSNTTDELIRIRVLANSNSTYDQEIKNKVSKNLRNSFYELLKNTTDIDVARNIIKDNLYNIGTLVSTDLEDEKYSYNINYGMNYFPEKTYNNKIYKDGYYESLLVTLGKGEGDNWWCILFPPLCLIEVEESDEEVEYDFFFNKLVDSIFH